MSGEQLLDGVAQHVRRVRFERSLKLTPRGLDADRFVLVCGDPDMDSVTRVALIEEVLARFPPPPERLAGIRSVLGAASHVHFGHERLASGESLLKAYAERAGADVSGRSDVEPLGTGFKWLPGSSGAVIETRYRLVTGTWWQHRQQLASAFCADFPASVTDAVALLAAAAFSVANDARPPMLIESDENGGSQRRAFTLRMHGSRLRVRDVALALAAMNDAVGAVPGVALTRLIDPSLDGSVSFVAAGRDRDGDPFMTIYFDWQSLDLRPDSAPD